LSSKHYKQGRHSRPGSFARKKRNKRYLIAAIILIVLAVAAVFALIFSNIDRTSQAADNPSQSSPPTESPSSASTQAQETESPSAIPSAQPSETLSTGTPIGAAIDNIKPTQFITSLSVNGQDVVLDEDSDSAVIDLGKTADFGEVKVETPQGVTVNSGEGNHRLSRGDNMIAISVSDKNGTTKELSLNIKRGEPITFVDKSVFNTDGSMVCLTMDDGTPAANVEKALDIFKQHDVKCTFFVCGDYLKAAPEIWQRAISEGHEVAWHSMHHENMLQKGADYLRSDIEEWETLAHQILGDDYQIPAILRLPYGAGQSVDTIQAVLKEKGYRSIYWSVDPFTEAASRTSSDFADVITSKTSEDSIILIHFKDVDLGALEQSIEYLTSHFKLGRVSDFLD